MLPLFAKSKNDGKPTFEATRFFLGVNRGGLTLLALLDVVSLSIISDISGLIISLDLKTPLAMQKTTTPIKSREYTASFCRKLREHTIRS